MRPKKIALFLLLGLAMALYVLLTGCAGATVGAKISGEPDYKTALPFIPRVEGSIGYTF